MNVLITSVSRRVSLVRNFHRALLPLGGRVITADFSDQAPALFFGHVYYPVPLVSDPRYLEMMADIARRESVALIVPTIDEELQLWADNRELFAAEGITVSISSPETVAACNDKWRTWDYFKSRNLPFPQTFLPENLPDRIGFPLFIKPRNGRGSVNSFMIKNQRELDFFISYVPQPLLQEYLQGREFTVDAFFDRHGRLISYVPRYRMVIRAGVSDRGMTFRNQELEQLIIRIGREFSFQGAVNIQGKIHREKITFFEINPRFSGGIQLSTAAGPDFAEMLVAEQCGRELQSRIGDYREGVFMFSYEDSVFLDPDSGVRFFYAENPDILPKKR